MAFADMRYNGSSGFDPNLGSAKYFPGSRHRRPSQTQKAMYYVY